MSRIDEAMRLARQQGAQSAGPAGGLPPAQETVPPHWDTDTVDETDPPVERRLFEARPAETSGSASSVSRPDAPPNMALFKGFNPAVRERVVGGTTNPGFAEQYRQLAATLHHAQVSQQIRVVLIASAVSGEGKTLTATNLALTLSESYKRRVLLIDADLRRPSLHEVFQVPNVSGLNEGLQAAVESKLPLLQISDALTVLPAGRPNPDPMSSLTSGRMGQILREAATCFDWVIVDTPPVALMADANLLAAMADTILLVVRAGHTPFEMVEKAVEALGRERIMGVVLNEADYHRPHSEYYSYRGYGPTA